MKWPGIELLRTLLTAVCVWLALQAWNGFTDQGAEFSLQVAAGALVIALIGWFGRARHRWLALAAQVLALVVLVGHFVTDAWVPTLTRGELLWRTLVDGARVARSQPTPVPDIYPEFTALLLCLALTLLVAGDVVANSTRQPAALGFVLLLIVSIAAAIYIHSLNPLYVVGSGALWLALVALAERQRGEGSDPHPIRAVLAPTRLVVLAGLAALALPTLVPQHARSGAGGDGGTASAGNRLINPVLNLKRDLTQGADLDLVFAQTDADPTYLRLSVLDEFTGVSWQPSDRELSIDNSISNEFPSPEGLTDRVSSSPRSWSLQLSKQFETTWLPLPYATSSLSQIPGQWRVDPSTLDVTSADGRTAAGYDYQLSALTLSPTKQQLVASPFLTGPMAQRMTRLPDAMPPVFRTTARRVTRGALNDFERAVKLQRWFREGGGFTYSTATAPGTGIGALANFITINKVGYCEQFATSMAVLAREVGIPARVVVGFLRPAQRDDTWVYSSHDLHAWPELFFGGVGWVRFEPTPGSRSGAVPSYTQGNLRPTSVPTPRVSVRPSPKPTVAPPAPVDQGTQTQTSGTSTGLWWLAGALGLAGLLWAPRLVRAARRRHRLSHHHGTRLAQGLWDELHDSSIDAGLRWTKGRSPRAVNRELIVAGAITDHQTKEALTGVTTFIERERYDRPRELSEQTRAQVLADFARWEESLRADNAKWWPRSLRLWRRR